MFISAINDPIGNAFGFDDSKHHPIVPEPSTYGLILLALTVAFVLYIRFSKRD